MVDTRLKQVEDVVKSTDKKLNKMSTGFESIQKTVNMQMGLADGRIAMIDKRMDSLDGEVMKIGRIELGMEEVKESLALIAEALHKDKKEQQTIRDNQNQGNSSPNFNLVASIAATSLQPAGLTKNLVLGETSNNNHSSPQPVILLPPNPLGITLYNHSLLSDTSQKPSYVNAPTLKPYQNLTPTGNSGLMTQTPQLHPTVFSNSPTIQPPLYHHQHAHLLPYSHHYNPSLNPNTNGHTHQIASPQSEIQAYQNQPLIPKLMFPSFDGNDPRGWINKSHKYFQFQPMNDYLKVSLAAIHLEGEANDWFQAYQVGRGVITWPELIKDLSLSVVHKFNKLKQTSTVSNYQGQFEQLRAQVLAKNYTLTEEYFVESFLSGLWEEVRGMVQMFGPTTLMEAYSKARLQEAQLLTLGRTNKHLTPVSYQPQPTHSTSFMRKATPFTPPPNPNSTPSATNTKGNSYRITKRLTDAERQLKREKGICYTCDEPFTPSHKCKNKKLFLMVAEEEGESEEEGTYEDAMQHWVENETTPTLHLSINVMDDHPYINTIKLKSCGKSGGTEPWAEGYISFYGSGEENIKDGSVFDGQDSGGTPVVGHMFLLAIDKFDIKQS
ncbi:hypothetical protein RJ639_041125 [Escallonia herrerae]|uniref:Ty3 transposon capsid-like protein domain-containing protein n=1 Tax=Escallonia herrerae TaxID=1293975 RepID=A0AA88WJB9_9ASTE|nr:hypothetical protein RJ639_041125 [Escallonia herrerae]